MKRTRMAHKMRATIALPGRGSEGRENQTKAPADATKATMAMLAGFICLPSLDPICLPLFDQCDPRPP